jgi:hypothetical protein
MSELAKTVLNNTRFHRNQFSVVLRQNLPCLLSVPWLEEEGEYPRSKDFSRNDARL